MAQAVKVYVVVEGSSQFPYDMLRYDQLWPWYGEDSAEMADYNHEFRRVVLMGEHDKKWTPTEGRWKSFGWRVVQMTHYSPTPDVRKVRVP